MLARMTFFPGRSWSTIAEPDSYAAGRGWWKLAAVDKWLDEHPEIGAVAWCDDELRGGRPAAIRRRFATRGLEEPCSSRRQWPSVSAPTP